MKQLFCLITAAGIALALAGCGGSGSHTSSDGPGSSSLGTPAMTGMARISILWPSTPIAKTTVGKHLIPSEAQYVRVLAFYDAPDSSDPNHSKDGLPVGVLPTGVPAGQPVGVVKRPDPTQAVQATNLTFTGLPVGVTVRFVAQAFLGQPGAPPASFSAVSRSLDVSSQLALTYGDDPEVIKPGGTTTFTINMRSSVKQLTVTTTPATLPNPIPLGYSFNIHVTPGDANGGVVTIPTSNVTFTIYGVNPGLTVQQIPSSFDATVRNTTGGQATLLIKESESGLTQTFTYTATGSLLPGTESGGFVSAAISGSGPNSGAVTIGDVAALPDGSGADVLVDDQTFSSNDSSQFIVKLASGITFPYYNPGQNFDFNAHLAQNTVDLVISLNDGSLVAYNTAGSPPGQPIGIANLGSDGPALDLTARGSTTYVLTHDKVIALNDSSDLNTPNGQTTFDFSTITAGDGSHPYSSSQPVNQIPTTVQFSLPSNINPGALALDNSGNFYITDINTKTVVKFDATGAKQTFTLQNAPLTSISDVTFDGSYLYVLASRKIYVYALDGTLLATYPDQLDPAAQAPLTSPSAIDAAAGHLFVSNVNPTQVVTLR